MTDAVSMQITGLAELTRTLGTLPAVLTKRVLLGAVASGASVIRQEAIRRAPYYTGSVQAGHPPPGTLRKAIYQTRLSRECTPTREVWIVSVKKGKALRAVKRGKKTVNLDAYYASWVEFGTAKMAARPFMRPAFETQKGNAFAAMDAYMRKVLPDAVAGASFALGVK